MIDWFLLTRRTFEKQIPSRSIEPLMEKPEQLHVWYFRFDRKYDFFLGNLMCKLHELPRQGLTYVWTFTSIIININIFVLTILWHCKYVDFFSKIIYIYALHVHNVFARTICCFNHGLHKAQYTTNYNWRNVTTIVTS